MNSPQDALLMQVFSRPLGFPLFLPVLYEQYILVTEWDPVSRFCLLSLESRTALHLAGCIADIELVFLNMKREIEGEGERQRERDRERK